MYYITRPVDYYVITRSPSNEYFYSLMCLWEKLMEDNVKCNFKHTMCQSQKQDKQHACQKIKSIQLVKNRQKHT